MARDRCTAHRRDGQPCGAPAIEFGTVCRRHGGAAQQVRFAAERTRRQMRLYDVQERWREQGGGADYELLGAINRAQAELWAFEAKLDELSRLRAAVAGQRRRAAAKASEQGMAS